MSAASSPGLDHERVTRLIRWLRDEIDRERQRVLRREAARSLTTARAQGHGTSPDPASCSTVSPPFGRPTRPPTGALRRHAHHHRQRGASGRYPPGHLLRPARRSAPCLSAAVQRRIVLRMSTEDDYSMLGVPKDVLGIHALPAGRIDEEREIQVARPWRQRRRGVPAIKSPSWRRSPRGRTADAPPIRSLPADVDPGIARNDGKACALRPDGATLAPFGIEPRACFVITGPPGSGRTTALGTLLSRRAGRCPTPSSTTSATVDRRSRVGRDGALGLTHRRDRCDRERSRRGSRRADRLAPGRRGRRVGRGSS